MACPWGPDGRAGIERMVEFVEERRELVDSDVKLMLDCWMAFDVDYTVRLIDRLEPYDLTWIEEPLPPEQTDGYARLRKRAPSQTLATGEHWYALTTFQQAAVDGFVDVLQPDIMWAGGLTALRRIAHIVEPAGVSLVPHAGGNSPYGQHACYALPAVEWTEFLVETPPGVPLDEWSAVPGTVTPDEGRMTPPSEPGFGVDIEPATLTRWQTKTASRYTASRFPAVSAVVHRGTVPLPD